MRILIVQNTDWLKRNPTQQHHLAEKLSLRGHEIRVIDYEILWRIVGRRSFCSKRKVFNNVSKIYDNAKVTVIRPSILKIPFLEYASVFYSYRREITQQIKEFAPHVIVSLGVVSFLAGRLAKRSAIPFIYYWIDVSHRLIPFKPLQLVGWMMERRALRLADRILVINRKLREYVIRMGGPPEITHVLGTGVDLERFNLNINIDTVRESYGIKKSDLVLFFMGWLYPFSGLKEVAMELARVKDAQPNIRLLIVGEGDLYHRLQQIQKDYGLQQLILAGWQPYEKIPEHVAASDICLLPAYNNEIMRHIVPMKMYEYMACGKPVISTRLPGVIEEFGEHNGVIYVEKPENVIEKAVELVRNNELKRLEIEARSFVEKYRWDNIADESERILEDITDYCFSK